MPEKFLREIRLHGRGGQGVWTSARVLSIAAMYEGYNIKSFPEFGPERTGAPTVNFVRYSNESIRQACGIEEPDYVIVIEPNLFGTKKDEILKGVKPNGKLIVNCSEKLEFPNVETHTIDVTTLARKKYNIEHANIGILGGYIRIAGDVSLESMSRAIMDEMVKTDVGGKKITKAAEVNVQLMKDVYGKIV